VKSKKRTGTALLRADISLAEGGKAPTEIRLLRAGVNESDYGPFLFDELAAAMVMASFSMDGKPRLQADWNHGMLDSDADRERAAACASFVPVVRDGELWASDIQWTEDGREDVEGRRYNYFSPAFAYEYGEDGNCRPRKLINFALVNRAGLKDIDTLLAASARDQEETSMAIEDKLETELRTRIAALEGDIAKRDTEIASLRGVSSDVVALSSAIGVRPDAANAERLTAVTGLVALRGSICKATGQETPEAALASVTGLVALRAEVFSVTGQATPEGAVAALRAMKTNSDKAVALEAKMEQDAVAALSAEFETVLTGAVDSFKLVPAKRDEFKASLLGLSGGKVTKAVVDAAKVHVAMLSAQVVGGTGTAAPATAGGLITEEDRQMQAASGGRYTIEQIQAFKASRLLPGHA